MNAKSPADDLLRRVARKVLVESLSLQKGESLTVESWNNGLPFARQVVLEARRIGAIPLTIFEDEDAYVEGARTTPKDVLGKMGKHEYKLLSGSDAYVFIPGPVIGMLSRRLTREEVADSTAYVDSWYRAAAKAKLRGVRMAFGYVGQDVSAILGKSVDTIVTHQLNAALVDFRSIRKKASELSAVFSEGVEVEVKTPGSALGFRLTGVKEVDDGVVDAKDVEEGNNVCYMPPGYVYAELDPKTVTGRFAFSPTATRFGVIKDGTIEFRDGKVSGWTSKASSAALSRLAGAAPEKARQASAITVGLNPLLKYGYGQNAHSAGVVGIRVLGVSFTTNRGSLDAGGKAQLVRGHF